MLNTEWIKEAVEMVEKGVCSRLQKDNVTVYRCGNVIRIDIKIKDR